MLLLCSTSAMAVRFSQQAKDNCQLMDTEAGTVTLIFATDADHFNIPVDSLLSVYVSGSISDLADSASDYRLDMLSEDSCFYHTFTCDQLTRPGNSGQPEFVFYVVRSDSTEANIYADDMVNAHIHPGLLCYNGNPFTLILMPCGPDYFTTDLDELEARCRQAQVIRPLADYDLTDSIDQHRICNFRLTPGTHNLYRSYHPYYPDMPQYDTETERLFWVAELARRVGIRSDITLSSNKSSQAGEKIATCGEDSIVVSIPDYHQALIDSGNILYVGAATGHVPKAGPCYYHSEEVYFAAWMQEVVEFIIDTIHPMPIQIHCALGADRTGMFCATIAALCGADWQTIIDDYQETSNMQSQTYRHPNRLRYAMQRLTGLNPDHCTTAQLSDAIRTHFISMGVLTNEQIDRMVARLTDGDLPMTVPSVPRSADEYATYDILGRPVNPNSPGIVIRGEQKTIRLY